MLCYKDRTFCSSDCTNSDCYRFYGLLERAGAKAWGETFGREDDPPVAFSDYSGDCEYYKPGPKIKKKRERK